MEKTRLVERLEGLDVDVAGHAELTTASGVIRQLRGWLDSVEGRVTRRAAALHESGNGAPPEDLLARSGRTSRRRAERTRRRSETLGDAPEVDRQLAAGRIGHEHADALTNAAGRLGDADRSTLLSQHEELAQAATTKTPEQFRRFLDRRIDQLHADAGRERSERQRDRASISLGKDDTSGMGYVRGELHPDDFQQFRSAMRGEVAALRKLPEYEGRRIDQLNAIALVNLTTGARATHRRAHASALVLFDFQTLTEGLHEHTIAEYGDGSPVPLDAIRRHACDAGLIPVVFGGESAELDVGRSSRLATPEQRAALRAMYRTCGVGGCERPFDLCEIHHLIEWDDLDGPTDLDNLLPMCSYHHHRAHEGRWRLELDADSRELTVWLPDGTLHSRCRPDLLAERRARPAA